MTDRQQRWGGAALCAMAVALTAGNHLWLGVIALATGWLAILTANESP
jgi:hypothetical protein